MPGLMSIRVCRGPPINGMNPTIAHRPDLFTSCIRLTVTAPSGGAITTRYATQTESKVRLQVRLPTKMTIRNTTKNRKNHQYSDLLARPSRLP